MWLKDFMLSDDNGLLADLTQFKSFKNPVKIIWGDLDTVTPPWQGEAIKSFFPNSKLKILKGVGHIPMIENESEFFEALINSN